MSAIDAAKHQSAHGPRYGVGECLMRVRGCYGVAARYPDASTGWLQAAHKHRTTRADSIPRGVPVWWTGGSHGYGHVAISAGAGWCWSTDIDRPGYFDRCRIADIEARWGLPLQGWTEDINGVRVWTPPKEKDWYDMATKDDLREIVREELARLFRDSDSTAGPDITGARIERTDGTVVSLGWVADVLQDLAAKG